MKKSAKTWFNYLIAVLITGFIFCGAFIPFAIGDQSKWPAKYVCYTMIFGGIAVVGIGFITQDIYRAIIRKRINDWDNKLDEEYENKAWAIFFPLLVGGFLAFIVGIISNFFVN